MAMDGSSSSAAAGAAAAAAFLPRGDRRDGASGALRAALGLGLGWHRSASSSSSLDAACATAATLSSLSSARRKSPSSKPGAVVRGRDVLLRVLLLRRRRGRVVVVVVVLVLRRGLLLLGRRRGLARVLLRERRGARGPELLARRALPRGRGVLLALPLALLLLALPPALLRAVLGPAPVLRRALLRRDDRRGGQFRRLPADRRDALGARLVGALRLGLLAQERVDLLRELPRRLGRLEQLEFWGARRRARGRRGLVAVVVVRGRGGRRRELGLALDEERHRLPRDGFEVDENCHKIYSCGNCLRQSSPPPPPASARS